jgi:hypothetical protein
MCKSVVWNDGVVPVQSAIWKIKDFAKSKSLHTDLTGTSDFSSFVKPRLTVGPKGNHNPEVGDVIGSADAIRYGYTNETVAWNLGRVYGKRDMSLETVSPNPETPFAKSVKLGPKQSVEIEIPIAAGANFGVTFMASSDVSAILSNQSNVIVGTNLTKTADAAQWFRSIFYDKPTTAGTWHLKLENTSDRESEVVLTTWSN